MFEYINDIEGIKSNTKLFTQHKLRSGLKIVAHFFSFISYIADNAILIGLIVQAENELFKTAKTTKDAFSFGKYSFELIAALLIICTCLNQEVIKELPIMKQKSSSVRLVIKKMFKIRDKKEVLTILGALLKIVTLMSTFGIMMRNSEKLVCCLEICRFLLGINKSLLYS